MELLLSQTDAKITHVPSRGGIGQAYNDTIGRLDTPVVTLSNAPAPQQDRQAVGIGRHLQGAHPGFPNVPNFAEKVVPDFDVVSSLGFAAPAGLPPAARDCWHDAFKQALARPAVKDKLEKLDNDTRVSTPAEFRARVERDMSRWRPLAHVVGQS